MYAGTQQSYQVMADLLGKPARNQRSYLLNVSVCGLPHVVILYNAGQGLPWQLHTGTGRRVGHQEQKEINNTREWKKERGKKERKGKWRGKRWWWWWRWVGGHGGDREQISSINNSCSGPCGRPGAHVYS